MVEVGTVPLWQKQDRVCGRGGYLGVNEDRRAHIIVHSLSFCKCDFYNFKQSVEFNVNCICPHSIKNLVFHIYSFLVLPACV